jgi:hypothetical protein
MTRKDYVTVAEILNGNRYFINESVFAEMVKEFGDYFANDNERFDFVIFENACNGRKK